MIFGFGKKRREPTFKERVEKFWNWFPGVAGKMARTIDDQRTQDLTDFVGEFMAESLPSLGWVFGGAAARGHSFTVTGEGVLPRQLLAEYWQSRAVQVPGWSFHGSRQPTGLDEGLRNLAIKLGENAQVDVETFLMKTSVDEEEKKIHLKVWHPALELVPQDHHFQILFLLLDEALGEFGTEMYLGKIEIEPFAKAADTKTLADLPKFVQDADRYYQWNKLSPLECYTLYHIQEQSGGRRGDTILGSTCIPGMVSALLENGGRLEEDPIAGTGAEFVYLAVDGSIFPAGNPTDKRGEIEDALREALGSQHSGRTLGGATGRVASYIDMLLFDGDNSRQIVTQTMAGMGLGKKSRLEPFA